MHFVLTVCLYVWCPNLYTSNYTHIVHMGWTVWGACIVGRPLLLRCNWCKSQGLGLWGGFKGALATMAAQVQRPLNEFVGSLTCEWHTSVAV